MLYDHVHGPWIRPELIDERSIEEPFSTVFTKSEIDVCTDKVEADFDSDSPILKWDRTVQNGSRESSEQGAKLWYNAIGRVLGTLPMLEANANDY